MNILFFCQLFYPILYGGGEYVFFQWARELVHRGHRVFVIAQKLKRIGVFENVDGIQIYRVGPSVEYQGVLPPSVRENLGFVISAIAEGISILIRNDIHIIHSNTYAPALAGQICANVFRKPHIVTFHDAYFLGLRNFWSRWGSQRGINSLAGVLGPFSEKLVMRLPVAAFHTVSDASKRDLLTCGVKRIIKVIPNGIYLKDYDEINSDDYHHHQAIYVGRLVFYKNLDTVIYAFKKVLEELPNGSLVIVGDGPVKKDLENEVENLGISDKIVFTGRIPHEEKVKLLKESALLVLPSVCEGFGIAVIEAFACNRCVLVSDVRPLSEVVEGGKDGFLVNPFDHEDWANKIKYLFYHTKRAKEMGGHGRRKIEEAYTVQMAIEQLENLYYSLSKG